MFIAARPSKADLKLREERHIPPPDHTGQHALPGGAVYKMGGLLAPLPALSVRGKGLPANASHASAHNA